MHLTEVYSPKCLEGEFSEVRYLLSNSQAKAKILHLSDARQTSP
jgi:hypothetical protein